MKVFSFNPFQLTKRLASWIVLIWIALFMSVAPAGCAGPATPFPSNNQRVQQERIAKEVSQRTVYEVQNNLDFTYYNMRQEISDDPTTIIWCTFFPPTVGQEPFTVPIVGKLTSSNKSPFPREQVMISSGGEYYHTDIYNPELPGPDAMFGSSSEYRYGFGPSGAADYMDFTDLPSFCTSQPRIWQENETRVVVGVSETLQELTLQAKAALERGDIEAANTLLYGAGAPDDE